MPLEVAASLNRQVAIYLAGEDVEVTVTVKNVSNKHKELLAWGSVQMTCERTIGAQAALPDRPTTAIARSASTVHASLPQVIFCDVQLAPGESRSFTAQIELAANGLPPTFRGQLVKYLNRITVAVQHVKSPIKLLHIPIRVIPAVGIDNKPPLETNPFLSDNERKTTISQVVIAAVDEMTAGRRPQLFALTNTHGRVATLTLFKKVFRLGDDVIGHMDFSSPRHSGLVRFLPSYSEADVACMQYSANLENEERLAEDTVGSDGEKKPEGRKHTVIHAQDNIVCMFASDSVFRLCIPLQAPPTFFTDTVHLKWRLRFEFVTCAKDLVAPTAGNITNAPQNVPIETLSWHVDIYVLPCSPENLALTDAVHNSKSSLII